MMAVLKRQQELLTKELVALRKREGLLAEKEAEVAEKDAKLTVLEKDVADCKTVIQMQHEELVDLRSELSSGGASGQGSDAPPPPRCEQCANEKSDNAMLLRKLAAAETEALKQMERVRVKERELVTLEKVRASAAASLHTKVRSTHECAWNLHRW
jgi:hypothetical protein